MATKQDRGKLTRFIGVTNKPEKFRLPFRGGVMLSVKSSQKIKTSLFIVFLMVSMTWSAGINDIVSKYEQRDNLTDNEILKSYAGCDSVTRSAGTPVYIDPINGSASWSGTINCPKNSLSEAVSVAIPGDEIILQSGNYHDNVTIDNLDDLVIRAADGASVVFDGTKSIIDDLVAVWGSADSDGIQEVDLPMRVGNYSTIMMSKCSGSLAKCSVLR